MPLSNREKLEIIARAKKNGYRGDYLELFRMAEQQMRQDRPEVEFRGGGFSNDINRPGKSTYVDARSGYGFPTTYEHGGPHQDLTPAITNVSNIYQSPEYLNRLKAEYKNAHGIDLSDEEALNIANTNIQSVQQGNPNALDFNQYPGPATIPSDAVGFKANPSQNVYLSTDPSMNDPYYTAVPGLGTPMGHTVKTTAQSAAEHEVAHRANTGPLSVMTSADGNPLQPELAEYYSTFFTNAPENNPYNPNTDDNFSQYAQLPYEVKSQKKQLELALQDARIWNPSEGPFTQEHIEKLRKQRFTVTGEGLDYMAQGLNLEDITTDYMSESRYRDENSLYNTERFDLSPSTKLTRFTDYGSPGNVQDDQRYSFRPFKSDLNDYLLDPENSELPNSQGIQNRMNRYLGRYAASADAYGRYDSAAFKTKDQGLRDEGFTTDEDQFQLDSFKKLQEAKPHLADAMQWVSENPLTQSNAKEWHSKYDMALHGIADLKEIYRKDANEQDERYKYNQRIEQRELEEQYKIDKEEFEKNRKPKEENLIKFMNEVAMDDPFDDSNQVAKHGGFAAFFASDYDKYVKKEEGGTKNGVDYTTEDINVKKGFVIPKGTYIGVGAVNDDFIKLLPDDLKDNAQSVLYDLRVKGSTNWYENNKDKFNYGYKDPETFIKDTYARYDEHIDSGYETMQELLKYQKYEDPAGRTVISSDAGEASALMEFSPDFIVPSKTIKKIEPKKIDKIDIEQKPVELQKAIEIDTPELPPSRADIFFDRLQDAKIYYTSPDKTKISRGATGFKEEKLKVSTPYIFSPDNPFIPKKQEFFYSETNTRGKRKEFGKLGKAREWERKNGLGVTQKELREYLNDSNQLFEHGGYHEDPPTKLQGLLPLPPQSPISTTNMTGQQLRNAMMQYLHDTGRDTVNVNTAMRAIGEMESRNNPMAVQVSGNKKTGFYPGPGKGKFQYEDTPKGAANTAVNRLVDLTKSKLGVTPTELPADFRPGIHKLPVYPELASMYKTTTPNVTELDEKYQDALFIADNILGKNTDGTLRANIFNEAVNKTNMSQEDVFKLWLKNHKKKITVPRKGKDVTVDVNKATKEEINAEMKKWMDRTSTSFE